MMMDCLTRQKYSPHIVAGASEVKTYHTLKEYVGDKYGGRGFRRLHSIQTMMEKDPRYRDYDFIDFVRDSIRCYEELDKITNS
jgi:hypothetical protein